MNKLKELALKAANLIEKIAFFAAIIAIIIETLNFFVSKINALVNNDRKLDNSTDKKQEDEN